MSGTTYAVLGVGALGAAIVTGLSDSTEPPTVRLSPRSAALTTDLASRYSSVSVQPDNQAAVTGADVVVVCVRPGDGEAVLRSLSLRSDQVVVSAMAGVSVADLLAWVAPVTRVARVIPLPAVASHQGVTPVHPPIAEAVELFERLGGTVEVSDERTFEALSASTATVAAYFAYLGAIASWLVGQGLPEEAARSYVASTFDGASGSLSTDFADFDELVREVATPGGLNEQFAGALSQAGVSEAVRRSLDDVLTRLVGG